MKLHGYKLSEALHREAQQIGDTERAEVCHAAVREIDNLIQENRYLLEILILAEKSMCRSLIPDDGLQANAIRLARAAIAIKKSTPCDSGA